MKARRGSGSGRPFPRGFQERERPVNVGADKRFRAADAAVDVRFGGEMDDRINLIHCHQFVNQGAVADIAMSKNDVRVRRQRIQIFPSPRVGQRVQNNDAQRRIFSVQRINEVGT